MAPARPSRPLHASALVSDEELERLLNDPISGPASPKNEMLHTGSASVDAALGGGVPRGGVVGVWGDGGSDMSLALLADALVGHPNASAAVVDTSGNFDVPGLYSVLAARLGGGGGEDEVVGMLGRVKIMRVFDLVGVMEAVGEVRDELDGRKGAEERPKEEPRSEFERRKSRGVKTPEKERDGQLPTVRLEDSKVVKRKTVIADSEDEDEEMLEDTRLLVSQGQPAEDDDEILEEMPLINEAAHPTPSPFPEAHPEDEILWFDGAHDRVQTPCPPDHDNPPPSTTPTTLAFLLIDNLAHAVTPLLKGDYIKGQALVTSFLLTLSHLTHVYGLHTVLLNPSVPPRTHAPPPPPSIFASNKTVPALLGLLAPYLDMELLLSRMPRRKADARAVNADGDMMSKVGRGVEMVGVLEVMGDRWGGRGGAWGKFVCGEGGVTDVT